MSINIFNSSFSKVYDFFLPAPKADSLVDKVLKLFMAIILAVKYSVGFVTSSLKKENPKTTNEQLAFAANTAFSRIKKAVESSRNFAVKNQSTIIKVVIAAAVVTGAAYAYRSYNSEIQTHPDDSRTPDNVGIFLSIVLGGAIGLGAALPIVKLIKSGPKAKPQEAMGQDDQTKALDDTSIYAPPSPHSVEATFNK